MGARVHPVPRPAPPARVGAPEVESFLSWLANRHGASVSTHKQALAALLFLYKRVLDLDLPWMQEIGRPRTPQRLPVVMSRVEVQRLLAATAGIHQLVFRLFYGTGMRKMERLRLRVEDLDFDRRPIVIREGKGNKDRITLLPSAPEPDLNRQLDYAKSLWKADRAAGRPGVETPPSVASKYRGRPSPIPGRLTSLARRERRAWTEASGIGSERAPVASLRVSIHSKASEKD